MSAVQDKLRGKTGCTQNCTRNINRRNCFVAVFLLAFIAHLFGWISLPWTHSSRADPLCEPLPSTYEWDVSEFTSGEHLSPLFDRRGVPGMQLTFSCDDQLCSLGLLAPDSWRVEFVLHAGLVSEKFSAVFPFNGTNILLPGLRALAAPTSDSSYHKVSIEVTYAIKTGVREIVAPAFTFPLSDQPLTGKVTSPKFGLGGLEGLTLQLYLSGKDGTSEGDTSAIFLCAPASTITYRLFIDDVVRTMTHEFADTGILGIFSGSDCKGGFENFAFRKESYTTAGVEILHVLKI